MAYKTLQESDSAARQAVDQAIKNVFSSDIVVGDRTLRLEGVDIAKELDPQDYEDQRESKMRGSIWGPSVFGKFVLMDKDGKVLDRSRIKLMTLPQKTARHGYIYNGQEYQFDTQFRLKPGIYTRITDNGEYASRISADGKYYRKTEIYLDPETRKYTLNVGTMNMPLATLIDLYGINRDELESAVGKEVAEINAKKPKQHEYNKLYSSLFGEQPKTPADMQRVVDAFQSSKLDPDATEYTTGKRLTHIDKSAILASMNKLYKLVRGETHEDDPNSLVTKSVMYYDDYLKEFINKQAAEAKRKISYKLANAKKVADAVPTSILAPSVSKLMTSPLAQRREQHNVLDILSGVGRTTLRGPGGISDPNMVRDDMRTIHSSQLGFLDPVKTPEGDAIGTTLYMTATASKRGNDLISRFIDVRTGKEVDLTPRQVYDAVLAFPDEYDFSGSTPKPKKKRLSATYRGEIGEYDAEKVQYVTASPHGMFHFTTNLIPFLRSNVGVRAMTASRQIEQAIPLVHREAPMVQVKYGKSGTTAEDVIGNSIGAVRSPVDGVVRSIESGRIVIDDNAKHPHTVGYYRNFPLNNAKGYINSELKVKPGDKVTKGQVIADSNFTQDGRLALGTNLHVAYVPWKGLTFEDAVVVSETAAKKLTSDHLHQFNVELHDRSIMGRNKYQAYFPNELTQQKASKLDDDGVIKSGEKVEYGDFLFAGLSERNIDPDSETVMRVSKNAVGTYSDDALKWEKKYPGIVTDVQKMGKKYIVHVKTEEPAVEGDKIVGRHGNKGIIAGVIPDNEMPHDVHGKAFDILMNPAGIVGRINLGQVFETAAGKVAAKTGKPVVVDNFDDSKDAHQLVEDLLHKAGVHDSETITDPKEGATERPVLTGYQYIFKLTHQVDKKLTSRGAVSKTTGERLPYSSDMSPARGGKEGGQSIGQLDTYALLAHGANANLREMFSYKSDAQNSMFWNRLKNGGVLPEPEVPFTAKKFLAYLEGMGVHVKKDGDKLHIMPLTDKDIERMSSGKLNNPSQQLDFKLRPVKGGLFDSMRTGGLHGNMWSHIELPTPVVNPIAKDGVIRLLAYAHPEHGATLYDKLLEGKLGLDEKSNIVPVEQAHHVGAAAVQKLLKKIDVKSMLVNVEKDLREAPVSKINVFNKTRKYLQALNDLGYKPDEAYILTKFPVLPPAYRPLLIDKRGDISHDDVNSLYKKLGETVEAVGHTPAALPPEQKAERSAAVQDMVDAVTMSGYSAQNRTMKSIMQTVTGTSPKYGFYQRKVLKRRQDLSARSTVVPNPDLDMDSVEIPEKALWELYSPFVTKNLVKSGYSTTDALTHVKDKSDLARTVLQEEMKDRPLMMKRDPVLHKFGIQSFFPKFSPSDTIRVPPSVTSGYNMDFDGDTASVFVPATEEAKEEAKRMLPSKNIFSTKGGGLMHKPDHEAQLGLFMLTEEGRDTKLNFSEMNDALEAYKARRIKLQDTFTFQGKRTTLGRLLLASVLPQGQLRDKWATDIMYNPKFRMDKKRVNELLVNVGKNQSQDFPGLLQRLRLLGDQAAFKLGGGFTLKDFKPLKSLNGTLSNDVSTTKRLDDYLHHRDKVEQLAKDHLQATDNNLLRTVVSGARGNWDQLKQIVLSPGVITNTRGEAAPKAINKSYSEGLSLSDYWTTLHGARRGMVSKVRGTALPGYLSRQIITSVADVRIVEEDCHTDQGAFEPVGAPDIIGRYTAKPQKVGKVNYPKDTLVDDKLVLNAKTSGVDKLLVRTPLKCEAHDGICAKCYGKWHDGEHPPIGTNIGVISAQSLGEPTTQLSMKLFHEGGIYSKATQAVDQFQKAKQIFEAPQKIKDEAVLAKVSGTVNSITPESTGNKVIVAGIDHFVPKTKHLTVKVGQKVSRGDTISEGDVNVHTLTDLAGVGAAQNHLVGQLQSLYQPLGVNKRHIETVVRYMTDLGVVEDAPDGSGYGRGDVVSMARTDAYNKRNVPVEWAIGLHLAEKYHTYGAGTEVTEDIVKDLKKHGVKRVKVKDTGFVKARSVIKGVNALPLLRTDDWAAKMSYERLKETMESGTLTGAKADLSGKWPVPAVGFGKIKKPGTKS